MLMSPVFKDVPALYRYVVDHAMFFGCNDPFIPYNHIPDDLRNHLESRLFHVFLARHEDGFYMKFSGRYRFRVVGVENNNDGGVFKFYLIQTRSNAEFLVGTYRYIYQYDHDGNMLDLSFDDLCDFSSFCHYSDFVPVEVSDEVLEAYLLKNHREDNYMTDFHIRFSQNELLTIAKAVSYYCLNNDYSENERKTLDSVIHLLDRAAGGSGIANTVVVHFKSDNWADELTDDDGLPF